MRVWDRGGSESHPVMGWIGIFVPTRKCAHFHMVISSQESFDVFLKEGKQVNTSVCAPNDICLRLFQDLAGTGTG